MTRQHDESLQANTEALTALEKRVHVVQQILEEIANELGWLARNIQNLSIGDGGAKHSELVQCMECDCIPIRGLAEALRAKWSELMLHDGRYVGLCPDCAGDAKVPADAAARPRSIVVDAEQFARAMENVEVLSDSGDVLVMSCAECQAVADVPYDEAVKQGWQEVGEHVDGHVGLCPTCVGRKAESPSQVAASPVPTTARSDRAPASQTTRDERRPEPPQQATKRRTKQQPLYMRMFTDRHMTALVRAVGYAGFPASEGPQRMKPFIDEFGEPLMRAAADEVVEIDHTQDPPIARLTAQARKIAAGLLGRPPEAPPLQPHVPPPASTQELPAAADVPPQDAKPCRRRKPKGAQAS